MVSVWISTILCQHTSQLRDKCRLWHVLLTSKFREDFSLQNFTMTSHFKKIPTSHFKISLRLLSSKNFARTSHFKISFRLLTSKKFRLLTSKNFRLLTSKFFTSHFKKFLICHFKISFLLSHFGRPSLTLNF